MTSATASPPPFRFGPGDLKANARKFLERALVISALVHLSAAGVFRAVEQFAAREAGDHRRIPGRVDVIIDHGAPPLPRNWSPAPAKQPKSGMIIPVVGKPFIDFTGYGTERVPEAVAGEPREGPGFPGPDPGGPPSVDPVPPFAYADTPPEPLSAPKPVYSDWPREAGIEGTVVLHVLVGKDGSPKQIVVVRGPKALSGDAVKAVWRWTFRPGLSNGNPVDVWVEVPVTFQLSGG